MRNSFDEKILDEANDWINANQKVVLATVIQTWGSSPRPTGSRMIINEKGDFSGSVSGGCVESAVVREAPCETPIAGLAELKDGQVHLRGEVLRPDGSETLDEAMSAPSEDGALLGTEMANRLLERAGPGFFDWRHA